MREHSADVMERRRAFVRAVGETCVVPTDLVLTNWFNEWERTFIQREAERLMYEPRLPHGGPNEKKIVDKLQALAKREEWAARFRAKHAADKWEAVEGHYYKCEPLQSKRDGDDFDFYTSMRTSAHENRDWNLKWFAELMLKGTPEIVANFRMECKFLLRKVDGTIDRLVIMRNHKGELSRAHGTTSPLVALEAEPFSAPSKFRIWLNNKGGLVWEAGEREMNALQYDVANYSAWRQVQEVVSIGWHPLGGKIGKFGDEEPVEKGIWFFGDCAFDPHGNLLSPDEYGIYWYEEQGYMLSDRGRESVYLQGKPYLRPEFTPDPSRFRLLRQPADNSDREVAASFFSTLTPYLMQTTSDVEGCLLMGSFLAYGAAPEIFARYMCLPGLWGHGIQQSGKTTAISWLMNIWGFDRHAGLDLMKNTTPVGMQIAAAQYSNVPLWFDEYRSNMPDLEAKLGVIRSAFNRGEQAKFTADGNQREIRTAFIVSGEMTTSDSATRSRYPHVQFARTKWRANHFEWFTEHKEFFFVLGRYIMRNRVTFARGVIRALRAWMDDAAGGGINERDKLVHGVSYAAWVAAAEVLGQSTEEDIRVVRTFLQRHARYAAGDVVSEQNINIFWDHLISAYKAEAIDPKYFRVEAFDGPHPPNAPNQGSWTRYNLWLEVDPILSSLSKELAKQREMLVLKRKDLRDQMSNASYWLPPANKRFDFGRAASVTFAWGIDIDTHPLGYQPVTDEAYQRFRNNPEDGDPRRGPLFTIIQDVLNKTRNARDRQDSYPTSP